MRTNRGEAGVGVVCVWRHAAVRRWRVLGGIGRLASKAMKCAVRTGWLWLDVYKVGLCCAPPAVGDQYREQHEENGD